MAEQKKNARIKGIIEEQDIKSDFYIEKPVTFQSKEAKQIYRRMFDHAQVMANAAIIVPRKFQLVSLSKENAETIESALEQISKDIQREIVFVDTAMADAGLIDTVKTKGEITVIAKLICPQGVTLLNIIQQLDSMIVKLKTLYIMGELSDANSEDRAQNWKNRLLKVGEAIRFLGTQAYSATEKRKQESAERLENKRAKAQKKRREKAQKSNPAPELLPVKA